MSRENRMALNVNLNRLESYDAFGTIESDGGKKLAQFFLVLITSVSGVMASFIGDSNIVLNIVLSAICGVGLIAVIVFIIIPQLLRKKNADKIYIYRNHQAVLVISYAQKIFIYQHGNEEKNLNNNSNELSDKIAKAIDLTNISNYQFIAFKEKKLSYVFSYRGSTSDEETFLTTNLSHEITAAKFYYHHDIDTKITINLTYHEPTNNPIELPLELKAVCEKSIHNEQLLARIVYTLPHN